MRFALYAVLMLLAACATQPPAAPGIPTPSEADVLRTEGEWHEAIIAGNRAALSSILAEDFVSSNGTGIEGDRAEELEHIAAYRRADADRSHLYQHAIRVRRGCFVVMGEMYRTIPPSDERLGLTYYTTAWVWERGKWQLAALTTYAMDKR
jgi:hypothetical protein